MIKARCGHTCAVRWTREASSFSTAWRKFHQRWPAWGELHATRYPQQQRRREARLCLFLLDFRDNLPQLGRPDPARNLLLAERSYERMILLTFTACLTRRFRFALDRHNFATDFRASSPETRPRPAADSNHAGKGGANGGRRGGRWQAAACLRVGQTLALFHYLRRRPI
jgi:hypothetical protein